MAAPRLTFRVERRVGLHLRHDTTGRAGDGRVWIPAPLCGGLTSPIGRKSREETQPAQSDRKMLHIDTVPRQLLTHM
jgi:hypothetical protein